MKKKIGLGIGVVATLGILFYGGAHSADAAEIKELYRVYNPNSGEHFYTEHTSEKDWLTGKGWVFEGKAWDTPSEGTQVYRLYNSNTGDHHYTTSSTEYDWLKNMGWVQEGKAFNSAAKENGLPVYRSYNKNAIAGAHMFTTSQKEQDWLVNIQGWVNESIAFYAVNPVVDKTELNDHIEIAESLQGPTYTESSSQALVDAIAKAKTVSENSNASAEEVSTATNELAKAITNLVDLTELNDHIVIAESLQKQDYTEDSYTAMTNAIAKAKVVSENSNASAEEVSTATNELAEAITNLVEA